VVLVARRAERLEQGQKRSDPSGEHTLIVPVDLTAEGAAERIVTESMRRFGRIDGLVNNAGYGQRGPIELVSVAAIRRNFETNVFSLLALTKAVIPVMREQGSGRIINIGSVAGKIARPLSSTYDSTKHALEAFSTGLRGELAPFGIDVVLIRPGFISTEFIEAANQASGDAMSQESPYRPLIAAHRENVQKLRKLAAPPEVIARLVLKALAAPHPKPHYTGPAHAKLFLFIEWATPAMMDEEASGKKRSA
jgi:short-subunit dehydrogenase